MSIRLAAVSLLLFAVVVAALVALRSCEVVVVEFDKPAAPKAGAVAVRTEPPAPTKRKHAADAKAVEETQPPAVATAPVDSKTSAEGKTGVAIDVVDEDGKPVAGAAIRLFVADSDHWDAPGIESIAEWAKVERRPAAGETIALDAAKEADGIPVKADGAVDGVPFAPVVFTIRAGKVQHVRVVAAKPRTALVLVVDAKSDRPVVGARVVSVTENERRHGVGLEPLAPALSDADGRATLDSLSAGDHELTVNATGHRQSTPTWSGADLRVRLEPRKGGAKIVVKVLAPGGAPMKGIAVDLVGTDRVVKSDADGLAVFDDVEADSVMVSLDSMFEWSDAVAAMKLPDASPRRMAVVAAAVGETKEVVLGAAPAGTATIDGRLVREDGSPIAGVRVSVDRDDDRKSAETDAAGNVRFADLQKGLWSAHLSVGRNMWFLAGAVELTEGGHADAKWTLGSATIRGRLVAGADRHGVLGATVWFRGANTGAAHTDADGRYELPNARVGSYSVDAKTDNASAAPRNVVVPSDGDVVVELVEFGRVVVRFLAADRAALRGAEISFIAPGTDDVVALLKPGAGDDDLVAAAVAPGRYEVELALGGRKQRFPVEVKSGETAVVEVKAP